MAIGLGIAAVAGQLYGARQQYKAGKAAESQGRANAAMARAEAEEEYRRTQAAQKQTMGTAKARAFASGITMSGSTEAFLDDMKKEFQKELAWIRKSGASQASVAERTGKYQSQIAKTQALGSVIGAGQTLAGML